MAHDRNGLRMRCASGPRGLCLAAALALAASGAAWAEEEAAVPAASPAFAPETAAHSDPAAAEARTGPVVLTPYAGAIAGGAVYRLSPASLAASRARARSAAARKGAQTADASEAPCVAGGFLKRARDAAAAPCPAPARATLALSGDV